jgi:ubiquinone/menaquinone biosynthesis C-methylase UbiE
MSADRPSPPAGALATPEEVWRRYDAQEARLAAPLSARMLDLAGVGPGQRVLDLATGRGEPAIPAAHRVGPRGAVIGVDPAASLLAMARERADREGLDNLELRAADAASPGELPAASFDAVLSRWGLMYMADPVAALRVARQALRPGGRLVAAVWAEPARVSYVDLPRRALARHAPLPPLDLAAPGTFYYADQRRLAHDLAAAGLAVTHVEELALAVMEAHDAAELVAWTRAFGMDRLLAGLPEATQRAWAADLVAEAAPLAEAGVVRLGGVTRIVVATPA